MGGLTGLDKKSQEIWFLACEFDQLLSPIAEKQVQFRIQNIQDLQEGSLKRCMHLTVLGSGISMYNYVGTQQLTSAINRTGMCTHSKGKNLQAVFSTCH